MTKQRKVDVRISGVGASVVQFEPVTQAARAWFADNVQSESWQWLGPRLGVDHRYAHDLAQGIEQAGLRLGWGA